MVKLSKTVLLFSSKFEKGRKVALQLLPSVVSKKTDRTNNNMFFLKNKIKRVSTETLSEDIDSSTLE